MKKLSLMLSVVLAMSAMTIRAQHADQGAPAADRL